MLDDEGALDIFAKALGAVFKDTEGIIVEHDSQLYIVYRDDKDIYINIANKEDKDLLTGAPLKHGMLVWMHKDGEVV